MQNNPPRWWTYARLAIRDYPELHSRLQELRETSVTAAYTGMPHGAGAGDPVFEACARRLGLDDQRAHDAVEKAIEWAETKKNGKERLQLIRLIYWDREKKYNLFSAAEAVGYSYWHARSLNSEFIYHVAFYAGMTEKPEK